MCLVLAREFLERPIETPLHLAFSYDEEVGCLGVRKLIEELSTREVKPKACIIGEPTSMSVIRAHKGKLSYRCHVHGLESHSGMTHLGVNAVEAAAEVIARFKAIARRFRDRGPFDPELTPPYTTVHTGVVRGGTQLNIVPKDCWFDVEIRHMPDVDADRLYDEVKQFIAEELLPEMHAVSRETGFTWQLHSRAPGLDTPEGRRGGPTCQGPDRSQRHRQGELCYRSRPVPRSQHTVGDLRARQYRASSQAQRIHRPRSDRPMRELRPQAVRALLDALTKLVDDIPVIVQSDVLDVRRPGTEHLAQTLLIGKVLQYIVDRPIAKLA